MTALAAEAEEAWKALLNSTHNFLHSAKLYTVTPHTFSTAPVALLASQRYVKPEVRRSKAVRSAPQTTNNVLPNVWENVNIG